MYRRRYRERCPFVPLILVLAIQMDKRERVVKRENSELARRRLRHDDVTAMDRPPEDRSGGPLDSHERMFSY
jgi:hypothetical protein